MCAHIYIYISPINLAACWDGYRAASHLHAPFLGENKSASSICQRYRALVAQSFRSNRFDNVLTWRLSEINRDVQVWYLRPLRVVVKPAWCTETEWTYMKGLSFLFFSAISLTLTSRQSGSVRIRHPVILFFVFWCCNPVILQNQKNERLVSIVFPSKSGRTLSENQSFSMCRSNVSWCSVSSTSLLYLYNKYQEYKYKDVPKMMNVILTDGRFKLPRGVEISWAGTSSGSWTCTDFVLGSG